MHQSFVTSAPPAPEQDGDIYGLENVLRFYFYNAEEM